MFEYNFNFNDLTQFQIKIYYIQKVFFIKFLLNCLNDILYFYYLITFFGLYFKSVLFQIFQSNFNLNLLIAFKVFYLNKILNRKFG